MKSNTLSLRKASPEAPAELHDLLADWSEVEQEVGVDLEQSAQQTQALQRRRGLKSAGDLLRLILCYVLTDWSLRLVAVWAVLQGVAALSDVAVLNRLRHSPRWLGLLIGQILKRRCRQLQAQPGIRLRLVDATGISQPGSRGTDWRVHLSFDLEQLVLDGMEVTDVHGGESLARFPLQGNEILVADGGYGFVDSLAASLAAQVGVVVRINWLNPPLETQNGQHFPRLAWLRSLTGASEQTVWLSTPQGCFPMRLIACPLPAEAAARARQRIQRRSVRRGSQPKAETLFAAGFLLLLTNLPAAAWPLPRLLWLYRLRWQIELHIKRLKSLLGLDHLRAQDPRLVQAYLLGKLLAALLLDELTQQVRLQQPEWFLSLEHPLSAWLLTACLWEALRQTIVGPLSLARLFQMLPALQRYFCNSPRARPQQLAWARALLEHLNASSTFFGC